MKKKTDTLFKDWEPKKKPYPISRGARTNIAHIREYPAGGKPYQS